MKPNRTNQTYIGLWMPIPLVKQVKVTAEARESDMSKFIRAAIREKLERVAPQKLRKEAA
ncbi:ribbon-helix-helix protein, CopG family [Geminisphaera colitermitum]|uniref:ribbon-helix-helix protein, CopG family n=1 Tax=Geminisphaera colitermitum TaxID=1148786 RepID=UPI000196517E|nr:ribbon-helix-helix protein, CopG family [Geminisphaera colitermitum]